MFKHYSKDENKIVAGFNVHDVKLLIILLIIVLILLVIRAVHTTTNSRQVIVSIDSKQVISLPLDIDTTYAIESPNGGYNLLHIENGSAYITDASCPDKTCEHQGHITQSTQMLICLPNHVSVSIVD